MRLVAFGALLAIGCGGTSTEGVAVASPEAPIVEQIAPTIELREIGAGDRVADRCFFEAKESTSGDRCAGGQTPAVCAERCRGGELEACAELAVWFVSDRACSAKLWQLACDRDHLPSCTALGGMELETGESAEERRRGRERLERACEAGHGGACSVVGAWAIAHQDELPDAGAAAKWLERGCDLRDGQACALAGHASAGTNPARAADLLGRACELGWLAACIEVATYHLAGNGVPQDEARARQLLEQVCSEDEPVTAAEACYMLAYLERDTTMMTPRARALNERACELGHGEACSHVVIGHYEQGRDAQAVELATRLLERDPDQWLPRYTRSLATMNLGRYAEAAADLERLCDIRSADWPHCHLMLFAARGRAGGGDAATTLAASALAQVDEATWPKPVASFYLGKLGAKALLDKAKSPDPDREREQLCEAYYYLGQHHMIAGRRRQAVQMFQKSVATGVESFIEYKSALAELGRLGEPIAATR
jgi:TPR repeat protein